MRLAIYSITAILVFFLGVVAGGIISVPNPVAKETPFAQPTLDLFTLPYANPDRDSPSDHVPEDAIEVYDNKVVLNIDAPQWAKFTDTNSMDPVIDASANAIEIVPKSPDQISVGDIISYQTPNTGGTIIHRVVDIAEDDKGWYVITKGDNNPSADPFRVRFTDVRRLVVAIVY